MRSARCWRAHRVPRLEQQSTKGVRHEKVRCRCAWSAVGCGGRAGLCRRCPRRGPLAQSSDQDGRALPAGFLARPDRTHAGRTAGQEPRSAGYCRQQAGCRWQHRHRGGGQGGSGWLYHPADHQRSAGDRAPALQEAQLRPGQGPRPGHAGGDQPERAGGCPRAGRQQHQGIHCPGQVQTGRAQLRVSGCRQRFASGHGNPQDRCRPESGARAVRRLPANYRCHSGRPGAGRLHGPGDCHGSGARRQAQGAGGHQHGPQCRPVRVPHHG